MIIFDVKCDVTGPIEVTDSAGRPATVPAGRYRLKGFDRFVRSTVSGAEATGMDIRLVDAYDDQISYTVAAEQLARYIALDDVEVTI